MQFIRDLALVMLSAGAVVVVFPRLRLPVLLGYIVAGVLIGPHMPWRLLTDQQTMQSISNLGVVLLMFTLGLDSNLRKLRSLGAGVALAALVEVGLMLWVGIEVGRLSGLGSRESLFLGAVICFSSTMIAMRSVGDRGWRGHPYVAGMVAMLVSEDVLTVVLITVLSAVAAGSVAGTAGIAFTVLWRMLLFVSAALVLGLLLLPRLLDRLARRGRDEPLLVAALAICFGACLLAQWEGFSVAFGAFLAGVVVAAARCSDRIVRLVRPVRDMFVAIFFVAIGLLLDPMEMLPWLWPALGLAAAVIAGKTLACSVGAFVCAGRSVGDSLRTGLTMAQIGEFSFVIAALGIASGAVGKFLYPLTVTTAVLCMLASPLLLRAEPLILNALRHAPAPARALAEGYHDWISGASPAGHDAVLAKMLRRLLWHIGVNLLLVCAVFGICAFISAMLPQWWPNLPLSPVTRRSLVWAIALFVSLPMLIAVYRKADALGMLLAEVGISEQIHGVRTAGLRRVLGKLVPLAALAGMALLVAALGSSILPPRGVLIALLAIGAFTVWFLWGSLVRVHARMQAALRDLVQDNPGSAPHE